MKTVLLIFTVGILLCFSTYLSAQCGSCMPPPVVQSYSPCPSFGCPNVPGPSCQCTDPYCFSPDRTCMGLASCCEAFGNVGGMDEGEYEM